MILFRYLFKETLKTQLAVLFILLLIFISQQFIQIISDAADGEVPTKLISTLMLLNLPNMALLMLPISLFLAVLFAHGRLYAESEATVLHAVGFSHHFVMRSAQLLALFTMVVALGNTLFIAPKAKEREYQVMDEFKADPGLALLQKGRFMELDDGRVIAYIQELNDKSTEMERLFLIERNQGDAPPSLIVAQSGNSSLDKEGLQWLNLVNGTRYEGRFPGKEFRISDFERLSLVVEKRDIEAAKRKSAAVDTAKLFAERGKLEYMAELQWRISLPLSIPILTFLVVPLARVNPRQGRYAKLLPAILLYLAYFLLLSAGRTALANGSLPALPGLFLIPLFFVLVIGLPLNLQGSSWWNQMRVRFGTKRAS